MQQATGWLMAAGGAASMMPLFTMFLVFVVIYFLILRPQAKRQKAREAMLKRADKGDRIVTSSGIYGSIVGTRGDDLLIVKIADNVTVEMARQAVASIVGTSASTLASPPAILSPISIMFFGNHNDFQRIASLMISASL